jgi:hypothetical protein
MASIALLLAASQIVLPLQIAAPTDSAQKFLWTFDTKG